MTTRASDVVPRAPRYIWEERIPANMISIVAGRPGGGKSLFTAHLTALVSQRAHVILSSPENKWHEMVRPRLDAIGANLKRVHLVRGWHFPTSLGTLEKALARSSAKLVIIDPMGAHLDSRVSRFDDSIRKVSDPLDQLAEEYDCAIVLTEHVIKNVARTSHLLQAIGGGSSGLAAAAQMAYIIGKDPRDEDRVILVSAKSNIRGEPEPYAFQQDAVSFVGEDGRMGTAGRLAALGEIEFPDPISMILRERDKPGPEPVKLAEASEWLARYLYAAEEYQRPATEIEEDAKTQGISKKTLTRAKKSLGIESTQTKAGWVWKLPQELVDNLNAQEEGDTPSE